MGIALRETVATMDAHRVDTADDRETAYAFRYERVIVLGDGSIEVTRRLPDGGVTVEYRIPVAQA
jgi:hypothetical protein